VIQPAQPPTLASVEDLPGAIEPRAFRDAMGCFATGVTVVTTAVGDELYGMTVSAFNSLSLDPLLVLVCLDNRSRGVELIERSGRFAVNVLAADQAYVSARFAARDRPGGAAAFDGVPIRWGATGCPVVRGAAAHADCRVHATYDGGDHRIVVGRVVGLGSRPDASVLVFHRGGYRSVGAASPAPPNVSTVSAGSVVSALGNVSARRAVALPRVRA
jgi:3-hydroxy-9,10-secoandrosta-1,3,5(10)-triene-9,17-dione monooxygenase reductase component